MEEKDIEKKMKEAWNNPVIEQPKSNKEARWLEFAAKVFPARKRHYKKWLYPAAAVLIFAFSIGTIFYKDTKAISENVTLTYTIIENPSSAIKVITLPDSSVVEMEPHSTLRYSKNFISNRSLILQGRAFFRVQKDRQHPFTVSCNETKTTVLGTCFTVTGNNGENVEVKLYKGRVQMNIKGVTTNWILSPGEKFSYNNGKTVVGTFNRFKDFNDAPLSEICNYISQTYGYDVKIPQDYLVKKVTLRFNQKEQLNNVVGIVAQMYDLKPIFDDNLKKITLE